MHQVFHVGAICGRRQRRAERQGHQESPFVRATAADLLGWVSPSAPGLNVEPAEDLLIIPNREAQAHIFVVSARDPL